MEVLQPDLLKQLAQVREWTRSGEAKRLRVSAGLTLQEIGRGVGVGRSTVHRWETAKQRPTGEVALLYWRVLRQLRRLEQGR